MPQEKSPCEKVDDKEQYAVFIDPRFSQEASNEFEKLFPTTIIEPYKKGKDLVMFKATFPRNAPDVQRLFEESKPTFLDFVLPIDVIVEYSEGNQKPYEQVIPALKKVLTAEAGKAFKLEVKNEDGKLDIEAKSAEVLLGEKNG